MFGILKVSLYVPIFCSAYCSVLPHIPHTYWLYHLYLLPACFLQCYMLQWMILKWRVPRARDCCFDPPVIVSLSSYSPCTLTFTSKCLRDTALESHGSGKVLYISQHRKNRFYHTGLTHEWYCNRGLCIDHVMAHTMETRLHRKALLAVKSKLKHKCNNQNCLKMTVSGSRSWILPMENIFARVLQSIHSIYLMMQETDVERHSIESLLRGLQMLNKQLKQRSRLSIQGSGPNHLR